MKSDITDNLIITKETDNDNYKRYFISGYGIGGRIVLEKYNETWNLELMDVTPINCGIGTFFLTKVLELEKLTPKQMTVCPLSEKSHIFFRKNGFKI